MRPRSASAQRAFHDEQLRAMLPALCWVGGAAYALVAVAEGLRGTPGSLQGAMAEATGAAIFLTVGILHRTGRLRKESSHPVATALFLTAVLTFAYQGVVDFTPDLPIMMMLVALTASAFLLDWRYLSVVLLATGLGSASILRQAGPWSHGAQVSLLIAGVIGPALILYSRLRTYGRLDAAAREAHESAELHRALFEGSPFPKWVVDDGSSTIVEANRAACDRYGYTRRQFIGMSLAQLRPVGDAAGDLEKPDKPDRVRTWELETRHATAAGEAVHVVLTFAPIELRGRPAHMVVAQDVTQRERDREQLRLSDLRFQQLAKATNDAVWDWDLATGSVWWNENLARILDQAPWERVPDHAGRMAFVHPEDRERVASGLRAVVEGRAERWAAEYRVVRRSGEIADVVDRAVVLRDPHGEAVRMIGSMQDVTEIHHAQAALRRQERLSALGTLVAGVAHEINNPLTYMQGNVELSRMTIEDLLGDERIPPEARAELRQLKEQEGKVLGGVEQIARIAGGLKRIARRSDGAPGSVDPAALVRDVLDVIRARTKSDVEIVPDLAPTPAVLANAGELSQVVLNLLMNAADALEGRPSARIDVRVREEGGAVVVEVADNGPGMPAAVQERVFTPFFTTKAQGTGLGLSVCLRVVQDLGGSIDFESVAGRGTLFRVRLPAVPEHAGAAAGLAISK